MNGRDQEDIPVTQPLTERELKVLTHIGAGLSNREIGEQMTVALSTVKWYVRQIYNSLAFIAGRKLGLLTDPHELLGESFKLPLPLTSFVGRRGQIAEVKQRLSAARLVTLTGPGGTGKTRLAVEVARQSIGQFDDGISFISLASTTDPALVPNVIAHELGVVEQSKTPMLDSLQRHLAKRQTLLLLDNFEHLLEAAPLVAQLLAAAPRLRILVTSRELLRLSGEYEILVPPLSVPEATSAATISDLSHFESVSLFVQRAEAVSRRFDLTDDSVATVAAICSRLDGLPLAIELAAARTKLFNPQQMLQRLDSRLEWLTGGARDLPDRQRTLRATIDWSYNLLSEDEKQLFSRLAIFSGGRSLEAVEAICGPGLAIDSLVGLESLLNKSLLYQAEGPGGEPRFFILETIHEYARERLLESGEERQLRDQHLGQFVAWAEVNQPGYWRHGQLLLFEKSEAEMGNLRAAFDWAVESGNIEAAARLLSALEYFLAYKDHFVEGYRWVKRLRPMIEAVPDNYRVRLLLTASRMAYINGDLEQSREFVQQSEELARELDDWPGVAWSLTYMSATLINHLDQQQNEEGLRMAEQALTLLRELDDKPGMAQALTNLGNLANAAGDSSRAQEAFEECLAVCQETGEILRQSMAGANLSFIVCQQGDYERARDLATSFLRQRAEINATHHVAFGLAVFAGPTGKMGDPEMAARLLGASAALMAALNTEYEPSDAGDIVIYTTSVQAQLSEEDFAAAWAEGQSMTMEQAVAYALGDGS